MVADTHFYDLLGVSPSCSASELKRAYHKASLANHPDKNPDDAEAASVRFQEISAAYEVLSEDDARAMYDQYGQDGVKGAAGGGGPPGYGGAEFDDVFASMFGGMGGFGPGSSRAGGGGPRGRPRRTPDSVVNYKVTLADLYNGKTAKFQLARDVLCATCKGSGGKDNAKPSDCVTCKGTGQVLEQHAVGGGFISQRVATCGACLGEGKRMRDKDRCRRCKGSATQTEKQAIDVRIEPGMQAGERIVLRGLADMKPGVPETGDLVVKLELEEHDAFVVCGSDLQVEVTISLIDAITGFERIVIRHLDGRLVRVKKEPGQVTRPGDVDRIIGQGMPNPRGTGHGSLYVKWLIRFPEDGEYVGDKAAKLAAFLPPSLPEPPHTAEDTIDDEELQPVNSDEFGRGANGEPEWEDDEEADPDDRGCAPQ